MRTATLPRMKAATTAPLYGEWGPNAHEPDAEPGIWRMGEGEPVGAPPAEEHRSAASPSGFCKRDLASEVEDTSVISRL